jgi:hypothetical protein
MNKKIIEEGHFYIRILNMTNNDIEYYCFNDNYEKAIEYCKNNNIDIKFIKKWKNYFLK